MLAAVYWARAPRVVLPDRALCLPTFCHSLLTVNKSSSSSSSLRSYDARQRRSVYSSTMTSIMTLKLLRSSAPLPTDISVSSRSGDMRNAPQQSHRPSTPYITEQPST